MNEDSKKTEKSLTIIGFFFLILGFYTHFTPFYFCGAISMIYPIYLNIKEMNKNFKPNASYSKELEKLKKKKNNP